MTKEQLEERTNLIIDNLGPVMTEWSNEENRDNIESFFKSLEKFISSFWYMTEEMEKSA